MNEPSTAGQEGRLDSWKKIAAYLKRDVSTVQRWERRVHPFHSLILTRGARRVSFLRGSNTLVILRGEIGNKNLWQVDLDTGMQRQLTNLSRNFVIKDFDVSSNGQEIVFDRVQENSDLVLIDRIHH
jgi:hypothetical protein